MSVATLFILVSPALRAVRWRPLSCRESILAISALLCYLLLTSQALAASLLPTLNKPPFRIQLRDDKTLREKITAALSAHREQNKERYGRFQTNRQVQQDKAIIDKVLRSEGYYRPIIDHAVKESRIEYFIDPGAVYRVSVVRLRSPENVDTSDFLVPLKPGDVLRAKSVLSSLGDVRRFVTEQHCLYRIDVDYQVNVFHQSQAAEVIFEIAESPQVVVGDIQFMGVGGIDPAYLRARTPLQESQCFKRSAVDRARLTLLQTNLLASVDMAIGKPQEGKVPIVINVQERRHRTVEAGLGFQSDEGFGVSLGWEHRNLLGRAQRLTFDTLIAENEQSLSAEYTMPHFRRDRQNLTLFADIESKQTDAFDSKREAFGVEISRQMAAKLRGIIGVDIAFSEVEEDEQTDTFGLISFPLTLEYDRRDNILDPRRGYVAAMTLRPYLDARDEGSDFTRSTFAASLYHSLDKLPWRPTLAMRGAVGSIRGAARPRVPANERFYVGGGGSVRGYEFQSLGTLTENEPDGGLSFSEFSMETRFRFSEDWGAVVFSDGGWAEAGSSLDFRQLRWSAGLGLRYFTSFAPIRFDLAFPLDRRPQFDDSFQIYLSIGQAF